LFIAKALRKERYKRTVNFAGVSEGKAKDLSIFLENNAEEFLPIAFQCILPGWG
jgi:hypothetical protein